MHPDQTPAFRRFFTALILLLTCPSFLTAQTSSVVTVNADKVLVLNGRKVFPIGFSPGPPINGKTSGGMDALEEFHEAGALLFRIAQTNNWNTQLIAGQQSALDWAAQHGMYCWLNLRELSKFSSTDTNTPASLRTIVNTFKNHPALGLWKNFDEAWWAGVPEDDLQRGYEVIKQEDANHPVVQTHAPRSTVAELQPYNAAADILALDIYPVGVPPGANSLWTNKEISMVGDYAQFLDQVGNGEKEFWMIEQIAWSGVTPPNKTLVFPTFRQSRYMAYQAVINGARGLVFFGGNIAATLNAQDAPLGWNWTFWNNVLKQVVRELGDKSVLAPALVTTNSLLPITMSGTTWPDLEFCVREVSPYLYILASKRQGPATNVTFAGLPAWATNGEVLYEPGRTVTASNGQFTDSFDPFDVHIYRFSQTNRPPAILSQPRNRTNYTGTTVTLSVIADGTGPLAYRWRKNGTNLLDGDNLSGSFSPSLVFTNISLSNAGNYDVVVNGFGSITSSPVTLTVFLQTNQVPVITLQPVSLTNNAGATAIFKATINGDGAIYYQWSRNSSPLSDSARISGTKTAQLTLNEITSIDAGSYTLLVGNEAGATNSASASLTVLYPYPYYDPFSYSPGINLGGQINSNYLAWSDIGTSTPGPYITLQSGNLDASGLKPSQGNCIAFGGLGKSARFSFVTGNPVTSGTLYYSFALRILETNGASASGTFIAGFNNSVGTQTGQPTVIGTRLYVRTLPGGFNLGVSKNSSVFTDWVWDGRVFTTNQTLFIVGSYTFNPSTTNDDVSQMWVNPDPATFSAASAPVTSLVTTNGPDLTANQIASFVFLQRATNQPALTFADELRVGKNWADVTPISPPLIASSRLQRLANGNFQLGYTNDNHTALVVYASTNLLDWIGSGVARSFLQIGISL